MRKNILTCGADGGSLTIYQQQGLFYFETDESTMVDLLGESSKGGVQNSNSFNSLQEVLQSASDKYHIESLYLDKIASKKKEVASFVLNLSPDRIIGESWLERLFDTNKYYDKFVNLDFQTIKSAYKPIEKDNYLITYPYFIEFFKSNQLNFQNYVVGANMVYAWMPTTLDLDLTDKDGIELVLGKLNKGMDLGLLDYQVLKKSINNSIVGMSKFLHFVDPYKYPILDSKIYEFITGKKYSTGIDRAIVYVAYQKMMKEFLNEDISDLMMPYYDQLGYKFSGLRGLEMTMFYSSK